LTPDLPDIALFKTGKVVKVGTLTGGEIPNSFVRGQVWAGLLWIGNEDFQEAITNTIRSSGLFKDVTTGPEWDYELSAEILSQDEHRVLFVNYRIVDRSGQELWKENLLSVIDLARAQKESSGYSTAFQIIRIAKEAAAKDNLTQLVKKLSQALTH